MSRQVARKAPGDARTARRSASPVGSRRPPDTLLSLQRAAGNRATARLLREATAKADAKPKPQKAKQRPHVLVNAGSKLSAKALVDLLKRNPNVPGWVKKGLASRSDALELSGKLVVPDAERTGASFDDLLTDVFRSGAWELTTARAVITVKEDAKKQRTYSQVVIPDLASGEQLGTWMKTGPDPADVEFSPTTLHSGLAEAIYGWTQPNTATSASRDRRNFVVIVREINVVRPDGSSKVFTPGPDNLAEAILHEIAIHAGLIQQGKTDTHGNAIVDTLADTIGGFFRPSAAGGNGLEASKLSKEIFAYATGAG